VNGESEAGGGTTHQCLSEIKSDNTIPHLSRTGWTTALHPALWNGMMAVRYCRSAVRFRESMVKDDNEDDTRQLAQFLSARSPMTARQLLRLLLVGLGTSVVPLDTAVNIAFPDITGSFGLPIVLIQWVVICYVLTYASLMLAFGRVGDIWSHARVFRLGLLWSGLAYLLCGAASSFGWLLFCRFLQGIGASLIVSCAPAMVTGLFPEDKRSRAIAVFTLMYAIGSAAGPLLGGVLVQIWGWPAVFWFRAPIALTALLFLEGLPAAPRRAIREPLDIVGAGLLAIGISTLLLMLNQLQHIEHQGIRVTTLLVIGMSCLGGFFSWERRVAQPIVNLEFFRTGGFTTVNIASMLVYLTSFSVILFGPYYLVRFAGLSVPLAGAMLAASFAGSIVASPLAGSLIGRVSARIVAAFGTFFAAAGLALMGSVAPGAAWQTVALAGILVFQGFGVGLFQVAYMDIVMGTLPRYHRGVAGSIAMLSRSLGVVSGATLLTLVFHLVETARLAYAQTPAASFLTGYRATFWLAGAICGFAGLLVFWATERGRPTSDNGG
jgi:MFS family permease